MIQQVLGQVQFGQTLVHIAHPLSFLGQSTARVNMLPSQHYTSCNPRGTALNLLGRLLLALTLTLTNTNSS